MFELYDVAHKRTVSQHSTIESVIKARVEFFKAAKRFGCRAGKTEILHNGVPVNIMLWAAAEQAMLERGELTSR